MIDSKCSFTSLSVNACARARLDCRCEEYEAQAMNDRLESPTTARIPSSCRIMMMISLRGVFIFIIIMETIKRSLICTPPSRVYLHMYNENSAARSIHLCRHRSVASLRMCYFVSFLVSAAVDRSRYSLVNVPQLDVSVVVNGKAAGGSSCETVLASVGHRLSTLNVE